MPSDLFGSKAMTTHLTQAQADTMGCLHTWTAHKCSSPKGKRCYPVKRLKLFRDTLQ